MTKKETGNKKTRASSTSGYEHKENAFSVSIKEKSKYMQSCHSNCTSVQFHSESVRRALLRGEIECNNMSHFQMNKNVSSCILIFVFKSKIKVLHIMLDV